VEIDDKFDRGIHEIVSHVSGFLTTPVNRFSPVAFRASS
jgi:hypothetical protein